jgi:hypothetical protein
VSFQVGDQVVPNEAYRQATEEGPLVCPIILGETYTVAALVGNPPGRYIKVSGPLKWGPDPFPERPNSGIGPIYFDPAP